MSKQSSKSTGTGPSEPTFSIIILSYNSLRFIDRCLTSVFSDDSVDYEVVFVDNGSKDGSAEKASLDFGGRPNFRLVRNPENLGFAEGNNLGAYLAKGRYFVFLNIDTEVVNGWLRGIEEVFATHPQAGIVQPKLLLARDRRRFDSAGDIVDYFGNSTSIAGDWDEFDEGQYDRVMEIFSARGAALAIRKAIFHSLGGFDESFFLDYEDIDLSWRARIAGHSVLFCPSSVVYHEGASREIETRTQTRAFHPAKNRLVTLLKNYEAATLFRIILEDVSVFYLPAMMYHGIGRRKQFFIEARAFLWILVNMKEIMRRRSVVQYSRKVSDEEVRKFMIPTSVSRLERYYVMAKHLTYAQAKLSYADPVLRRLRKG